MMSRVRDDWEGDLRDGFNEARVLFYEEIFDETVV